ncbi:MAG: DUF72 domain-containing protein [Pseudomonadota bacterium]|nr:DUF72 domain-containing protein [Pseudomonadota bacterium]
MTPSRGTSFIGTAGWALPRAVQESFPGEGPHLARYARVFGISEINSSFYRAHARATYERWAAIVPDMFRFCVKLPKAMTHVAKLVGTDAMLDTFFAQVSGLGQHLGCILVQLPPSLVLEGDVASAFLTSLRERYSGLIAVEPRHESWFTAPAAALLEHFSAARVAADPARVAEAARPGGATELAYWRMHGSPRMYYSSYDATALQALAGSMKAAALHAREVWCIFDNTASGAAAADALALREHFTDESATDARDG